MTILTAQMQRALQSKDKEATRNNLHYFWL